MSDTPRTDALCPADDAVPLSQAIPLLQLCRTLERDLVEARREQDEALRPNASITCPASRHVEMMADGLESGGYPMLADEPEHCADSMRAVVLALWEARRRADTYKARCHALEHAVAESDRRDEEGATATLNLIHERDEARRDAIQRLEFSKHAYYAMNDAYNVLVTCVNNANTSDEAEQLQALTERLCDLCFQAFTLNGVTSKAQLDAAREAK